MPTVRTLPRLSTTLVAAGMLLLLTPSAHGAPAVDGTSALQAITATAAVAAPLGAVDASQPTTTPAPGPTGSGSPTTTNDPGTESSATQDATTRFWVLTAAGLLIAAAATVWSVRRVRAVRGRELTDEHSPGDADRTPTPRPDA